MPDPILPVVLRGPAIVIHNAMAYYVRGDIKVKLARRTFAVETDMFGKIDTRLTSQMKDIEFTPAGEIKSLAKYYPWGPSNLVAANPVSSSIFTGTTVIHTKAGKTITYERTGVSKMPTLMLSPQKTAFGSMTISALGKIDVQSNTAAAFKAIADSAFADATFDPTAIITGIYNAALGQREAPFDAMGARTGFELEPVLELDDVPDDNVGIADRRIISVGWKVRFAPNNLTLAELDEIIQLDGTEGLLPGQSVARGVLADEGPEDLVITGDPLTVTVKSVGLVSAENGYGAKVDQNGQVEFEQRHEFAAGVASSLIDFDLAA